MVDEQDKILDLLADHFQGIMGTSARMAAPFNWDRLNLLKHDMHELERPFTLGEIKEAI